MGRSPAGRSAPEHRRGDVLVKGLQPPYRASPQAVRQLAHELRRYRDRTELSIASLAAKTGYSRSSWHRYFAGRLLPPWEAVDALGRLAGADRGRLRVTWEAAADAWAQAHMPRGAPAGEFKDVPAAREHLSGGRRVPGCRCGGRRGPRWTDRKRAVKASALLGAVISLAVTGVLGYRSHRSGSADPPPGAPPGAPAWPWALHLPPADPRTDCGAADCPGVDPYRHGCDRDAVTVHRLRAVGRTLSLRWSPSCGASWAEVQPARGTSQLQITADDGTRRTASTGAAWTMTIPAGPGGTRAVVMVDGHQLGVSEVDSWSDPVSDGSGPR
ncbi:helix-turn-helix domain-containing protein [Streptomyces galbus]|uniref:helix-turn-helix domain-containing protein n=1 Tax=Streptomyces galbus TaxID=33898 RepID=UPI0037F2317B